MLLQHLKRGFNYFLCACLCGNSITNFNYSRRPLQELFTWPTKVAGDVLPASSTRSIVKGENIVTFGNLLASNLGMETFQLGQIAYLALEEAKVTTRLLGAEHGP